MLEILIVIALCRKIGNVMRGKGRKPLRMQILAVVAWFGGEFLFGLIWGLMDGDFSPALYIGSLLTAGAAAGAVYTWANSLDPLDARDREPGEGERDCSECGEIVPVDERDCPVCGAELRPVRRRQRSRAELDSFDDDFE